MLTSISRVAVLLNLGAALLAAGCGGTEAQRESADWGLVQEFEEAAVASRFDGTRWSAELTDSAGARLATVEYASGASEATLTTVVGEVSTFNIASPGAMDAASYGLIAYTAWSRLNAPVDAKRPYKIDCRTFKEKTSCCEVKLSGSCVGGCYPAMCGDSCCYGSSCCKLECSCYIEAG